MDGFMDGWWISDPDSRVLSIPFLPPPMKVSSLYAFIRKGFHTYTFVIYIGQVVMYIAKTFF